MACGHSRTEDPGPWQPDLLSQPSIVPRRQRIKDLILAIVLIAVGVVCFRIAGTLSSNQPVVYEDIAEHFKYGSIGSEPGGSLLRPIGGALPPYMVFKALPAMCSDRLPGGYARSASSSSPVATCRSASRGGGASASTRSASTARSVTPARCATRRAARAASSSACRRSSSTCRRFVEFILDCSLDSRVTENIRGRFRASRQRVPLFERILLRSRPDRSPQAADPRAAQPDAPSLGRNLPDWGRGRVDTFNPYKAIQFNWPLAKLPQSELIGASDFPSLWNQAPREGLQLHWDGDNDSVDERNLSAALGAGVTPVTVDHASIKRIRDWIWTLPPPEYPYPVDRALAARGADVYQQHCVELPRGHRLPRRRFKDGAASARSSRSTRSGPTVIGSTRTPGLRTNQYALFPESPYRFTQFRKTNGYANHPLDGIWLRAPYLHNGSVPTLRDLLEPPERRPDVLPGLRRVRTEGDTVFDTTPRCPATATADTSMALR